MPVDYSQSCRAVNQKTFSANYSAGCKDIVVFRGDRLAKLMQDQDISQSELARRIGVSQATIWKLVKDPGQGSKHTHKIARELGTTAEFLMGETSDQNSQAPFAGTVAAEPDLPTAADFDDDDEIVEVPEIDLAFGMGGGSYLEIPVLKRRRKFTRGWLRMFTDAPPSRLFIARGIGDSMAPTIQNADIVVIDASENRVRLGDQIWAIAYGELGMIKRLRPLPGGGVKILSDNPLVESETGYDGEVHVIGKVVAVIRRMAG